MEKQGFDFAAFKKEATARLKKGETLLGRDGVFTPLLKEFLEEAMDAELESHIDLEDAPNRKNGKGKKINILTYKPKEGSTMRRQGHRQPYTQVKIEAIKA